jgi:hypothetical protein
MKDQDKISRGQFLGLIGGMALAAVLFKFAGAKKLLTAVNNEKTGARASTAYGHSPYGGQHA